MPLSTQVGQQTYKYDKNPDVCPICHHAIAPGIIGKSISRVITEDAAKIDIAFQCTSSLCLRMFIGCYLGPNGSQDQLAFENKRVARTLTRQDAENKRIYKLIDVVPKTYKTPAIDQEIVNISKGFKEIYEQAAAAELYGLNEIAGVGYRKALEFLIKDYCIHKNPELEERIKTTALGAVINNYVDDPNVKSCAQRATWLGNDETHYVRKWENKNINDLKLLIRLTCNWVTNNILTEEIVANMERT